MCKKSRKVAVKFFFGAGSRWQQMPGNRTTAVKGGARCWLTDGGRRRGARPSIRPAFQNGSMPVAVPPPSVQTRLAFNRTYAARTDTPSPSPPLNCLECYNASRSHVAGRLPGARPQSRHHQVRCCAGNRRHQLGPRWYSTSRVSPAPPPFPPAAVVLPFTPCHPPVGLRPLLPSRHRPAAAAGSHRSAFNAQRHAVSGASAFAQVGYAASKHAGSRNSAAGGECRRQAAVMPIIAVHATRYRPRIQFI